MLEAGAFYTQLELTLTNRGGGHHNIRESYIRQGN